MMCKPGSVGDLGGQPPRCPGPNCPDTELSRHRIVPLAKGEAGLGDYQVRNWIAWHHHQTLSLLAAWFLNKETRRGKKTDPRTNVSATSAVDRRANRLAHENEPDCYTLSSKRAGSRGTNKHAFTPIVHVTSYLR